jgi:hypothetical protein
MLCFDFERRQPRNNDKTYQDDQIQDEIEVQIQTECQAQDEIDNPTEDQISDQAQEQSVRYDDPRAIYERYVTAREIWYKAQRPGTSPL